MDLALEEGIDCLSDLSDLIELIESIDLIELIELIDLIDLIELIELIDLIDLIDGCGCRLYTDNLVSLLNLPGSDVRWHERGRKC